MDKGPLIGIGRTAEIFAWGEKEVLKLYRPTFPTPAIDYEIRINKALSEIDFALPKIRGVVEVDGRAGLIFDRIDGPSLLKTLLAKPWRVNALARVLATLHVEMHHCPAPKLPSGLENLARRLRMVTQLPEEQKEQILAVIHTLPDGDRLCHGDFHPDNVLMAPTGPVIIDWTNATRGNPLADVARSSLIMKHGASPHKGAAQYMIRLFSSYFHQQYLQEYCRQTGITAAELEPWLLPLAAVRLLEGCPPAEEQVLHQIIADQLARLR